MPHALVIKNKTHPGQPLKYGDVASIGYDPASPVLQGWFVEMQAYRTETTVTDIPDELPDDGIIYQQVRPIATGTAAQNTTFWMSDGPFSESWNGGGADVTFHLLNADRSVVDTAIIHVEA